MPLLGLQVEPGEDLFGGVGTGHPFELAGEGELPIEAGNANEEEDGDAQAASECGMHHGM